MSEVEEINLEEASLQNSWVFVEDCDVDSPQNKYYLNCSTEPITELTDAVDKNELETDSDGISIISESDEAKEILADDKDVISTRDDDIDNLKVDDSLNSSWRFYAFAITCLLLALFVPMLLNYLIYPSNDLKDVSEYDNNDYLENEVGQELINVNIEVANNLNDSIVSDVKVNNNEMISKNIQDDIKDVVIKSSNQSDFKDNKMKDIKKIKDKSKGKKKEQVLKEEKKHKKTKKCRDEDKSKEIKGDKKFKFENVKDKEKKMKKQKERNEGKEQRKKPYYPKPEKIINSKTKIKPQSGERKKEKNKQHFKPEKNGNYKKPTKPNKVKIINNNNNLRGKLDEYYFSSRIDKKKIFNPRTKEQFYVMEEQYTSYFKRVIF